MSKRVMTEKGSPGFRAHSEWYRPIFYSQWFYTLYQANLCWHKPPLQS